MGDAGTFDGDADLFDAVIEDLPPGPLAARMRPRALDDVVGRLSELALYDIPLDFYEGYVRGVEGVGADAVRAAATSLLGTGRMAIVVAGDRAVIEAPLKALGLGPVVVLDGRPISED